MPDIAALYQEEAGALLAMLRRGGLTLEEAEDIASETWLRAWRNRDRLGERVWPWLVVVARRLAIDHARARLRHPWVALDWGLTSPMDTERAALGEMAAEAAVASITRLTAGQRVVVTLRALEWDYDEIATALHTNVSALRVMHYRGRRRLASLIDLGAA